MEEIRQGIPGITFYYSGTSRKGHGTCTASLYPLLDIDKTSINRDAFQQAIHKENIGTGIHFVALHLHPYYANTFGLKRGDFPNAEFVSDRTISLPLSAKLTETDTDDVICAVKKIIKKK